MCPSHRTRSENPGLRDSVLPRGRNSGQEGRWVGGFTDPRQQPRSLRPASCVITRVKTLTKGANTDTWKDRATRLHKFRMLWPWLVCASLTSLRLLLPPNPDSLSCSVLPFLSLHFEGMVCVVDACVHTYACGCVRSHVCGNQGLTGVILNCFCFETESLTEPGNP